jgi:hypothetical protein
VARGARTVVWAQRINNAQGRIRASVRQCYGLNSTGTPEAGNQPLGCCINPTGPCTLSESTDGTNPSPSAWSYSPRTVRTL